jgi:phosphotransferase system HPr-like phosphotransfer protein
MKQFDIVLSSFADVQDFVEIATVQPFRVLVGNDRTRVNAKSFMGIFSLDFSQRVQVRVDCTEAECEQFRQALAKYLA